MTHITEPRAIGNHADMGPAVSKKGADTEDSNDPPVAPAADRPSETR
ncbi:MULTISPECIES: hypothetical protein [Mycolicibacterium]|nr:hypothetical protein [Mycolicibacterium mageritense]